MTIYKIKNIVNDKSYIGQTVQQFCNRKGFHVFYLRKGNHTNPHLQNAWNKYGEKSFKFEVIEKCDSIEELNEREKYWIKKFGDYNLRSGGKNDFLSKEHKRKIGKANKISQKGLHKGENNYFYGKSFTGEDHPFYGKTHTIETRKKMSKPVIQYDLKGNFIDEYYGINEASRQTNISHSLISRVCSGKRKQTNGFIFKYKIIDKNTEKAIEAEEKLRKEHGS